MSYAARVHSVEMAWSMCVLLLVARERSRNLCSRPPTASSAHRPATRHCCELCLTRPHTSNTQSASRHRPVGRPSLAVNSASPRLTADTATVCTIHQHSHSEILPRNHRQTHGQMATATCGAPGIICSHYFTFMLTFQRILSEFAPDSHSVIKPVRVPVTRDLHYVICLR